jgi:hypothetical protein
MDVATAVKVVFKIPYVAPNVGALGMINEDAFETAKLLAFVAFDPWTEMKYGVFTANVAAIAVPDVAACHPTVLEAPEVVPTAIRYVVPLPPASVGVNDVVVRVEIAGTFGDVRNAAFPAKKLIFKLPDAAVGTVAAAVKGGGRVPGSTFEPTRPTRLPPAGVPNTSKIALPALAGAVFRLIAPLAGTTLPDIYFTSPFFQTVPSRLQ